MQRKYRSKEGASPEPQLPGNPREPGLREVAGNATRTTDQVNARLRFFQFLRKRLSTGAISQKGLLKKEKRRVGVFANRLESGSLPRRTD